MEKNPAAVLFIKALPCDQGQSWPNKLRADKKVIKGRGNMRAADSQGGTKSHVFTNLSQRAFWNRLASVNRFWCQTPLRSRHQMGNIMLHNMWCFFTPSYVLDGHISKALACQMDGRWVRRQRHGGQSQEAAMIIFISCSQKIENGLSHSRSQSRNIIPAKATPCWH